MRRVRLAPDKQNGDDDGDTGIDDAHNLANDVPDNAWELWQEMPADPRDESYRGKLAGELDVNDVPVIDAASRSDDLTSIIEDAVSQNSIVDLGSGTCEMDEEVSIRPGDLFAVVGDRSGR